MTAGVVVLSSLVASRSTETAERLDEALAAAVTTVGALPDSIAATLGAPGDLAARVAGRGA